MKILALDSTAAPASCALVEDGQIVASATVNTRQTHSQTLMPMIADMLKNSGRMLKDVTAMAASVGPGSFTGVRIGIASVKGLAFADDIPCVPVSTLEAMAYNLAGAPYTGLICGLMDARCQQVYTALFRCEDGALTRLTADEALPLSELQERLAAYDEPILAVGDGAEMTCRALGTALPRLRLAPPHLRLQNAVGVAMAAVDAAAQGKTVSAEALLPTYLRLPQAERELKMKQQEKSV